MKKIAAFVNHHSGSVPEDGSEAPERILSDPGYTSDIISFEEGDVKATRGWQSRANWAEAPDPG